MVREDLQIVLTHRTVAGEVTSGPRGRRETPVIGHCLQVGQVGCIVQVGVAGDRHADVDGGPTRLISPTLDLSTVSAPVLRYARWWANDDQDGDPFDVEISNDNGDTWVLIESVTNIDPGWGERMVYITDYITLLTDVMTIRFSVMDNPNNSKDEGGIDAVEVFNIQCP